ncbi:MAG: LacI family DNA-binding transcriptional regulator [Armatimonadota bacterium]|nr:LacI family DNA-binding transcriptional regulator [Armatimonadota bacterium]
MLPTIKDVAKFAGVSTATVSRVLNGSNSVSEETRIRVERAIADLGYRYNALARGLKKRRTGLLGHIVPSIAGPVSPALARAVEDQAQKFGYNVILCNSYDSIEKERAYIDILLERRADGIVMSSPILPEHITFLRERGMPLAIIERRMETTGFYFVEPDNLKGARGAVEYLIKLGHRRIAMITGPMHTLISQMRAKGYADALGDAGIPVDPDLKTEGDYSRASGFQAMQKFLAMRHRPTAVFAANDAMAIGAMQAAHQAGLKIPEDISFIGFDDTYAELTIPQLTSVHQPLYEIGVLAAKLVVAQIQGNADQYRMENILPCYLKERESCGPAPKI